MSFFSSLFSKSESSNEQFNQVNEKLDAILSQVNQIPGIATKVEEIRQVVFSHKGQDVAARPPESMAGMTYADVFGAAGVSTDDVVVEYSDGSHNTVPSSTPVEDKVARVNSVVEAQSLG